MCTAHCETGGYLIAFRNQLFQGPFDVGKAGKPPLILAITLR